MTASNFFKLGTDVLDPEALEINLVVVIPAPTFNFVRISSLDGRADCIETVYEHGRILQRDGVNGTALIQVGSKGDPFQVSTIVDVADYATAVATKIQYKAIVNQGLAQVVCAGIDYYTTYGHKYIINDVRAVASRVGVAVGGLSSGGVGLVEAVWTLIPVAVGVPGP